MPTYTYKCKECDVKIERVHGMLEDVNVLCGECGQTMIKIISECTFVLNGGGWGKDTKEKKERVKRSEKLKDKSKERSFYNDKDVYKK